MIVEDWRNLLALVTVPPIDTGVARRRSRGGRFLANACVVDVGDLKLESGGDNVVGTGRNWDGTYALLHVLLCWPTGEVRPNVV